MNLKDAFCTTWVLALFLSWVVGPCFSRDAAEVSQFLREDIFISSSHIFHC